MAAGQKTIETVTGPVEPGALGRTLVHEHVLCDFIGAEAVSRNRYDAEEVLRAMAPRLRALADRGIDALVDCTPAFIGRDPLLLRRLCEETGVRILTNTGYYGAAGDRFLPRHAYGESAGDLAARWIAESRDGIEGTGIRPGFIKTGVDRGPLSPIDRKLVEAAALTHLATGLTIACHTGEETAAGETLETVLECGVAADALIVVHADAAAGPGGGDSVPARLAEAGAWVELDGIGPDTVERHVAMILSLLRRGHLGRILLSHDAGWYRVGEARGGAIRDYTTIPDALVPALRRAIEADAGLEARLGGAGAVILALLTQNPARAFRTAIRPGPGRRPGTRRSPAGAP